MGNSDVDIFDLKKIFVDIFDLKQKFEWKTWKNCVISLASRWLNPQKGYGYYKCNMHWISCPNMGWEVVNPFEFH
jgi:hypothetical protein